MSAEQDLSDFPSFEEPGPSPRSPTPPSPPPPRRQSSWRFIAPVLLYGSISVATVYGVIRHAAREAAPPAQPGWNELALCNPAISIDGARRLMFADNGTATLQRGEAPVVAGSRRYDPNSKQYQITFGDQAVAYSLLSRDDILGCMLVKGALDAADLSRSWFAVVDDDPGEEPERDWQ
jgi:hypothetical protein